MDSRTNRINQLVKAYDYNLFASRNSKGVIGIFKNNKIARSFTFEGSTYTYFEDAPHLILSLTDNWNISGKSVDWGLDQIWMRLCRIDSWTTESQSFEEINKHNQKIDDSKKREFRNKNEAFFDDQRESWKKAFSDVNTSNLINHDKKIF